MAWLQFVLVDKIRFTGNISHMLPLSWYMPHYLGKLLNVILLSSQVRFLLLLKPTYTRKDGLLSVLVLKVIFSVLQADCNLLGIEL